MNTAEIFVRQECRKERRIRNAETAKKKKDGIARNVNYPRCMWTVADGYIKYPKNSNLKRDYKKISNRKVRRCKSEIGNGNYYRKIFDYWWNVS